ncbi:hypothetical protein [Paenibacillus sp. CMAA1364]
MERETVRKSHPDKRWRRTDMTVEQLIQLLVLMIVIMELVVRKGKS